MNLEAEVCHRILQARDGRFDGLLFVGVSSTGIYCRPICPAKTPKAENCKFFESAAQAEEAGYRPCLRCRPENAPGRAMVDALKSRATRAARLIEQGALEDQTLEEFAGALQMSSRHLRRAMRHELGVSPLDLAQTCRLLTAKKLLTETQRPIGEIALASGFGSLRRFNDLFQSRYRMAPSALRRVGQRRPSSEGVECRLSYRPPYSWDHHLGFLRKRQITGVEHIDNDSYSRSLRIRDFSGWLTIRNLSNSNCLSVALSESLCPVLPKLLERVKRVFDLNADPHAIANGLAGLADEAPGLRLPGAFDGFEAGVRAILGQQVTVSFATTLAGRFAAAFGEPVESPFEQVCWVFPSPDKIARLTQDDIAKLGIIGARARAIIELARAITESRLDLSSTADFEKTRAALLMVPGVGPWTAEYIGMRALSYPDAFPAQDVGIFKALGTRDPQEALRSVEPYRPWRSYAVMHLWKRAAEGNM